MAFKQPWRSDLKSDLKFIAQTTYATLLFGLFWPLLDHFDRRKKKERKKKKEHLAPLDLSASPQVKRELPEHGLEPGASLKGLFTLIK